jgi:hypothetical protein
VPSLPAGPPLQVSPGRPRYEWIAKVVTGRQIEDRAVVMHMGFSRHWVVDTLRRLGYQQEADEALRVLPDDIDLKQLQEFGDRHGISYDEIISRMGGSP